MMFKSWIVVLALFVSVPFVAAAGVSTSQSTVGRITADPYLVMYAAPQITDNDGCDGSGHYVLLKSHANFDALHAMMLTAFAANKNVSFWIEGCHDVGGGFTYPKIHQIYIYP